jgi:heme-degrading monooxygenase HmoA
MFCVLFEVHPRPDQWDAYLDYAKQLRPRLERMDGFIDNTRYRSLVREGWILSVSTWRDEKSLVRWRVDAQHHAVQEKGRTEVFLDYHLRIGPVTHDTSVAGNDTLREERLDETATGAGTTVVLIDASCPLDPLSPMDPNRRAASLGLDTTAAGLVGFDVFEAVLTPGDFIVMSTWRDETHARTFHALAPVPGDARLRQVRVVRDYGMFDRREAPQYYPKIARVPDRR